MHAWFSKLCYQKHIIYPFLELEMAKNCMISLFLVLTFFTVAFPVRGVQVVREAIDLSSKTVRQGTHSVAIVPVSLKQ